MRRRGIPLVGRDFEFVEALNAGQIDVLHGALSELQESQVQQVLDELADRVQVASSFRSDAKRVASIDITLPSKPVSNVSSSKIS
jgi:hypothetical protein